MKITPALAAAAALVATAPVAAMAAASVDTLIDQGVAYAAAALATALVSAFAAAITKLVGAKLDENARDALQTGLSNAALVVLRWVISEVDELPLVQRLKVGAEKMLPHVEAGNPGSLARFGMDQPGEAREHLLRMAEAKLIDEVRKLSPHTLAQAMRDPSDFGR